MRRGGWFRVVAADRGGVRGDLCGGFRCYSAVVVVDELAGWFRDVGVDA